MTGFEKDSETQNVVNKVTFPYENKHLVKSFER